jgi:hypothetical protein
LIFSHLQSASEEPGSTHNYDVLLEAVHDSKAGIVHIQYEQGLYRLVLELMNCDKTSTNIDSFFIMIVKSNCHQ